MEENIGPIFVPYRDSRSPALIRALAYPRDPLLSGHVLRDAVQLCHSHRDSNRAMRTARKTSNTKTLQNKDPFIFPLLLVREGANREKLTVKKLIDNEMFFFHRLCPLQTVKNRRKA